MPSTRVSVVVPVYNGESFIGEALASVFAQTRPADEVFVVDDGSSDGTPNILAQCSGIEILRQDNRGAGVARNSAIERSTGDLLAFLDADDLWLPDKLEVQRGALDATPECQAVFGHVQQFGLGVQADKEAAPMPGYIPSAMVIRREAFLSVGMFDTDPSVPEFAEWFLRAKENGLKMRMLPQVVARRRLHSGNKGRTAEDAQRGYLHALKASLDRRRARTGGQN